MTRPRIIIVVPLAWAVFCLVPVADAPSGQDQHAAFWQVVQTVKDILAGKNTEQARNTIAKGASLVYGARFENLRSVVAGEVKTCSLADTTYHGVMIQAESNPSEDMAFLLLKTVTSDNARVRFHTVVFMKDSTGQFRIRHWQTSD